MLFSQHFGVNKVPEDDWFDPILVRDTELFIDPFLLFDQESDTFLGSHNELVSFFEHTFELLALSGGNWKSPHFLAAQSLLSLGEVSELCLGYTGSGVKGSGSGSGLASEICNGILTAISQGLRRLDHFEEVQIFDRGIGPDRISDATAGILRHRLASYTRTICERHRIPLHEVTTRRAKFSRSDGRWKSGSFLLPRNPFTKESILLVPRKYLRQLPTINPTDFWEYCVDSAPEIVAKEFGSEISKQVNKETILKFARLHPEIRTRYVRDKELRGSDAYDLDKDYEGHYTPWLAGYSWSSSNLATFKISSSLELAETVNEILDKFQVYVENQGGWSLLWNDDKSPRKEAALQSLLSGFARPYCEHNNIDISREPNIGRGPVDFKLSVGYRARVLIEAKLASNSKFWNGIKKQLPTYMAAEGIGVSSWSAAIGTETSRKWLESRKSQKSYRQTLA